MLLFFLIVILPIFLPALLGKLTIFRVQQKLKFAKASIYSSVLAFLSVVLVFATWRFRIWFTYDRPGPALPALPMPIGEILLYTVVLVLPDAASLFVLRKFNAFALSTFALVDLFVSAIATYVFTFVTS
jgi:hypothetical protein